MRTYPADCRQFIISTPGVARMLRITFGLAESPIRNAASMVPAASAVAASSPPMGSSTVGATSLSLAFSSASASARVPLPSGPTASRLPFSWLRRSTGSVPR